MKYTDKQKRAMYEAGEYVFSVPPVPSSLWSSDSWIAWIDACNGWRPESEAEARLELSQGFDAGNFCNAYETHNLGEALGRRDVADRTEAYQHAFVLGFFSTYELHEISLDARQRFEDAYHSDAGQRVIYLGYAEPREFDDA